MSMAEAVTDDFLEFAREQGLTPKDALVLLACCERLAEKSLACCDHHARVAVMTGHALFKAHTMELDRN